jgi:hypothetical protein
LAGARHFITTNVFKALESVVGEIQEQIAALEERQLRSELLPLWKKVTDTVGFLKQFGKQRGDDVVDPLFNLLYLVTGMAYHRVVAELSEKPQHDERYSTVEEVADLLRLCAWSPSQPTEQPSQLLQELAAALDAVPQAT